MNAPFLQPSSAQVERMCSRCGIKPQRKSHNWCFLCHAAYMREWRKSHPLNAEQRLKDICRAYANVYEGRGALVPQPCEVCGTKDVEKHHPDYSKPLEVKWLCRDHHLELHRQSAGVKHETSPERVTA